MTIFDTIVNQCTPPLKSAVSIVRLTGKDAFNILKKMVKKDVDSLTPRMMIYGNIYIDKNNENTLIDKSMYVIFKGKESFCGEDTVEFYLHGSPIITNQVIQTCLKYGARLAKNGEFTYKAYYNNKLDLTEAEAINQLIDAKTERSKDYALKSLQGSISTYIKEMKQDLNLISAEIEVNIDYPEFDDDENLSNKIEKLLPSLIEKAKKLLSNSKQSIYLFNGIKIAIIGEPNVGKSTFLNKILGKEKAIVTNIPGTTRDIVEGEIEINGIIYKFYDTAGIRSSKDPIEAIGIKKAYDICEQADIILILSEKKNFKTELHDLNIETIINEKPTIFVATKKDLYGINDSADISISYNDLDYLPLFNLINKKLNVLSEFDVGLSSHREIEILSKFIEILLSLQDDIKLNMTTDVLEIKLLKATSFLDSLLNVESSLEDVYNTIFKYFCVGK